MITPSKRISSLTGNVVPAMVTVSVAVRSGDDVPKQMASDLLAMSRIPFTRYHYLTAAVQSARSVNPFWISEERSAKWT